MSNRDVSPISISVTLGDLASSPEELRTHLKTLEDVSAPGFKNRIVDIDDDDLIDSKILFGISGETPPDDLSKNYVRIEPQQVELPDEEPDELKDVGPEDFDIEDEVAELFSKSFTETSDNSEEPELYIIEIEIDFNGEYEEELYTIVTEMAEKIGELWLVEVGMNFRHELTDDSYNFPVSGSEDKDIYGLRFYEDSADILLQEIKGGNELYIWGTFTTNKVLSDGRPTEILENGYKQLEEIMDSYLP